MALITRLELKVVLRSLELLQNAYEAEIDDCARIDGYEDSEACRRAEIALNQTHELICKLRRLTISPLRDHATVLALADH